MSRIHAPTLQEVLACRAPQYRMGSRMGLGLRAPRAGGGAAPYRPWLDEPGAVLWMASDDPGVATTSAAIVDKDDFTTGNWTKTGVNVTADSSGVYDLLTATATTATTQQVPSNFSTGLMTLTFTADVIRVADDWVCMELFASAGGRVWFNLDAGTVGTQGANLSAASITPLGGGAFRLSATSNAGANYVMLRGASADNSLTCSIGHSFLASNVTVDQTRATAFLNMVSAVSWAQASANLQPRYNPTGFNGRPALEFGAQQDIASAEAAVLAALTNGADFTLFFTVANIGGANGTVFGAASSAANTNRTKTFCRTVTNTWRYATVEDGGSSVTSTSTSGTYAAGSHLVVWSSNAGAVTHRMDLAAQTLDVSTNAPVTLTPNRVSFGVRNDLTPDNRCSGQYASVGLWNVALDAAAISRVETYLRAKWGTP